MVLRNQNSAFAVVRRAPTDDMTTAKTDANIGTRMTEASAAHRLPVEVNPITTETIPRPHETTASAAAVGVEAQPDPHRKSDLQVGADQAKRS